MGLLNALYAHQKVVKTPEEIAEEACDIALNRLHEASGKQDEYAASLGGVRVVRDRQAGQVTVEGARAWPTTLSPSSSTG